MDYGQFLEITKPMTTIFYTPDNLDDYFKILFNMFKRTESFILKDAVGILIAQQETKRFPLPVEFKKAIRDAVNDRARASVAPSLIDLGGDFYCNKCANCGIQLVMKFDSFYNTEKYVAIPCTCSEGKKVAGGWRRNDEEKRQRQKIK